MFKLASKAIRSETFLTASMFGVSGLAFAAANIILAHVLPVDDYAVIALVIAVITLSSGLGLFGADGIVNRHEVKPDNELFARILRTSLVAAVASVITVRGFYDVGWPVASLMGIAIVAQATVYFAAAYLRSRHEFRSSLLTFNSSNYIILAVAVAAAIAGWQGAVIPIALMSAGFVVVAAWSAMHVRVGYANVTSSYEYSWREALAYISLSGSASVLIQLERLVTPKLLTLSDLATLGVLLAIVGPPFRLLHLTLGYVLLPKLRRAASSSERHSLILREIGIALSLLVPCWVLTWYLVPVLDALLFDGKYPLSGALVLAAIVAGTIKALSGIATASVTGLASAKHLEITGIAAWFAVLVSVAGAFLGARFGGLAGVVYGVSLGWLVRIVTAGIIVRRHLARDGEAPPGDSHSAPIGDSDPGPDRNWGQ